MEREDVIVIFEILTHTTYDTDNEKHVKCVDALMRYHNDADVKENLKSLTIGRIREDYSEDYPKYILRMIDQIKKRVKFV